eukprot:TRINITY_DN2247_c0_g2_i4.p1 TRINITY_DN2247_c0_g2~~TRINITY_DN2247_c0_g2_i4.p1  ORF type:complete len:1833 (-),score=503.06 TRINITY_DN2247_c0_g2_i4:35-5533(-)
MPVLNMIRDNKEDKDSRHLMILSRNNCALEILVSEGIVDLSKTEVIFGSDFPMDNNDTQICNNITRIKTCMEFGYTVILMHLDNLYESLYDMLNQHYTVFGNESKKFCRVAIGANSAKCVVHPDFKAIVLMDVQDSIDGRIPPPLLNRFEKQVLSHEDLMDEKDMDVLHHVKDWMRAFTDGDDTKQSRVFLGLNEQNLASMVLSLRRMGLPPDLIIEGMKDLLLWCATPEAVVLAKERDLEPKWVARYLEHQVHSDIPQLMAMVRQYRFADAIPCKNLIIYTHASPAIQLAPLFPSATTVIKLHNFSQELEFEYRIGQFWNSDEDVLVLQCNLGETTQQRLHHAKYIIQRFASKTDAAAKMIIFVVHLLQDDIFTFPFDLNWISIANDIETAQDLNIPEILSLMSDKTDWDHVLNDSFELRRHLVLNFRFVLSRLEYQYHHEIKDQIGLIFSLLRDDQAYKVTMMRLRPMLDQRVKAFRQKWYVDVAKDEHQIRVQGSYRKALANEVMKVIDYSFGVMLKNLDRNYNLNIFSKDRFRNLWLDMMADETIFAWEANDNFQVINDGYLRPFIARFPFSFVVIEFINGLRDVLIMDVAKYEEFVFQRYPFLQDLDDEAMAAYLYDLTEMSRLPFVDERNVIVDSCLRSECKMASVVEIHLTFWRCEQRLRSIISLFDLFPNALRNVIMDLRRYPISWKEMCLDQIRPIFESLCQIDASTSTVARVKTFVGDLMETLPELRMEWQKTELLHELLMTIIVPLQLEDQWETIASSFDSFDISGFALNFIVRLSAEIITPESTYDVSRYIQMLLARNPSDGRLHQVLLHLLTTSDHHILMTPSLQSLIVKILAETGREDIFSHHLIEMATESEEGLDHPHCLLYVEYYEDMLSHQPRKCQQLSDNAQSFHDRTTLYPDLNIPEKLRCIARGRYLCNMAYTHESLDKDHCEICCASILHLNDALLSHPPLQLYALKLLEKRHGMAHFDIRFRDRYPWSRDIRLEDLQVFFDVFLPLGDPYRSLQTSMGTTKGFDAFLKQTNVDATILGPSLMAAAWQECVQFKGQKNQKMAKRLQTSSFPDITKALTVSLLKQDARDVPLFDMRLDRHPNPYLFRTMLHIIATVDSQKRTFLHELLNRPSNVLSKFMPTAPEDEQMIATQAVLQSSPALKAYRCPQGHTCFIGDCGRPASVGRCPCGESIGGTNHVSLPGNAEIQIAIRPPPMGYLLGDIPQESKTDATSREMHPLGFRIIRFIINSLLSARAILGDTSINHLLGRKDALHFLSRHLENDWNIMKQITAVNDERLSIGLHEITFKLGKVNLPTSLDTFALRNQYEDGMIRNLIRPMFDGLSDVVNIAWRERRATPELLARLTESIPLSDASRDQLPLLTRYRAPMDWETMVHAFKGHPDNLRQHRLINYFMDRKDELSLIRYLESFVEWQRWLHRLLNKRITKTDNMTIEDVIAKMSKIDAKHATDTFQCFAEGWNILRRDFLQRGCKTLSQGNGTTNVPEISLQSPVRWCLPFESDDGLYSLAMMDRLVSIQNDLMIFCDMADLPKDCCQDRPSNEVPMYLVQSHHLVSFTDASLMQWMTMIIQDGSGYGQSENRSFDWKFLEHILNKNLIMGKSTLAMVTRMFEFLHDVPDMAHQHLKFKIRQVTELSTGMKERIVEELDSLENMNKLKKNLEMYIEFLGTTGGDANTLLCDYVDQHLQLEDDKHAVLTGNLCEIQLQHVLAVYYFLREKLEEDEFAKIPNQFRQNLSDENRMALQKSDVKEIVPGLRSFIVEQLSKYRNANAPLKEMLDEYFDAKKEYGHLSPFVEKLPETIQLCQALHVVLILEKM